MPVVSAINPVDGISFAEFTCPLPQDVETAMRNALAAVRLGTNVAQRLGLIEHFAKSVDDRKAELAALITRETAKPAWEAATEASAVVGKAALTIASLNAWTQRFEAETSGRATFRPLGVAAVMGPFNFPAHLPNGQIMPALLAGNAVIFKPSELTPAVGDWMVQRWRASLSFLGLPIDLVQVLHGGREVGEAIVGHAAVNAVLFTGSHAAGTAIHRQLAGRPEVLLALEMGGNNPMVVHDVSDLDATIRIVIASAFVSAGQRCTCTRRLIVTDPAFIPLLADATKRVAVDVPHAEPAPFMSCLIRASAAQKVMDAQADWVSRGGKIIVEAERLSPALVSPGIIDMTGVDVPDEEVFGPLLQVIRVASLDAAIEVANATRYGLAAGIVCDREADYHHFASGVRAGVVNWNTPTTGASGKLPFGGLGRSGNHRPMGYAAIEAMLTPVAHLEKPAPQAPDWPMFRH